jgi:hypothetical protein
VDCLTQAENTIFLLIYRYGDLLALFQAQRKQLAVKTDLGEIQLDAAAVEYARMRVALTGEERRRDNEQREANAEAVRQSRR